MCIAVSSSPMVCSLFILLAAIFIKRRSLTVLRYNLFVLSCLKQVNTICNTKTQYTILNNKSYYFFKSSDKMVYDNTINLQWNCCGIQWLGFSICVPTNSVIPNNRLRLISGAYMLEIYRGYYTVVRRYEFYVRLAHSWDIVLATTT